jgi:hypothetical protein
MISKIQRYNKFSSYLTGRFGARVYKVSVDAGFSCPNRDGRYSDRGCVFCDNRSFSFNTGKNSPDVHAQVKAGMKAAKSRYGAEKFMVYFQANTNTYADLAALEKTYDIVGEFRDIVSMAIGTRPDCAGEDVLDLIEGYRADYEVWMEYGLQSSSDGTLKRINRNHTYSDFADACRRTKKRGLKVCAHVIIGLPGESAKDEARTASALAGLKIDAVKIHPLHIVKGTQLENIYNKKAYKPLEYVEYVSRAVEFLKRVNREAIIQRITADCPGDLLVAPSWIKDKPRLLADIDKTLEDQDAYQGMLAGG